jgi:hypothetical protein
LSLITPHMVCYEVAAAKRSEARLAFTCAG